MYSLERLPGSDARISSSQKERRVPAFLHTGGVPVQDIVELLGGAERDGVQPARISDDVVQNSEPSHMDVPLGARTHSMSHPDVWWRRSTRPSAVLLRCSLAMVCSLVSSMSGVGRDIPDLKLPVGRV